jgi:hypothetical protein
MMESFGMWLQTTRLSWFVTNYTWVWPTCETLHFIGLAMLIGSVWILDLRMLGVAKGLPIEPLHRLIRWGIAGFIINVVTGVMFFVGTPYQYIGNIGFTLKMICIALAGINVIVFYLTVFDRVHDLEPGQDAPFAAKCVAVASLFFWLGAMSFGRLLPFFGNSF